MESGRRRVPATMEPWRSKFYPELPTVADVGYPGFEAGQRYGMLVPAARAGIRAARGHARKGYAFPVVRVERNVSRATLPLETPAQRPGGNERRDVSLTCEATPPL